jgi:hypothetical protein
VRRLLVTASVVPSSPIVVTPMKEAVSSAETSVLTRGTRRNTPEYAILHSHRRENLRSYWIHEGSWHLFLSEDGPARRRVIIATGRNMSVGKRSCIGRQTRDLPVSVTVPQSRVA